MVVTTTQTTACTGSVTPICKALASATTETFCSCLAPNSNRPTHGGPLRAFRKSTESAHAGWYGVTLDDHGVDVELTTTPRVGVHRYRLQDPQTP